MQSFHFFFHPNINSLPSSIIWWILSVQFTHMQDVCNIPVKLSSASMKWMWWHFDHSSLEMFCMRRWRWGNLLKTSSPTTLLSSRSPTCCITNTPSTNEHTYMYTHTHTHHIHLASDCVSIEQHAHSEACDYRQAGKQSCLLATWAVQQTTCSPSTSNNARTNQMFCQWGTTSTGKLASGHFAFHLKLAAFGDESPDSKGMERLACNTVVVGSCKRTLEHKPKRKIRHKHKHFIIRVHTMLNWIIHQNFDQWSAYP